MGRERVTAVPPFRTLGQGISSDPAAVATAPDRNDVLAIGDDGSVRHFTLSSGECRESSARDAPDGLAGNPALCSWGQLRLDAFVRDAGGRLFHNVCDGRWNGWSPVASTGVSADAAVTSWGVGRFDLFTRTSAGLLDHYYYHHPLGLSGPGDLGGPIAGRPAVVTTSLYGTQIVVRGMDDGLLRRQYHVPEQRAHEWTSTPWQPARGRFAVGPRSDPRTGDSLVCTADPVLVRCRGERRIENRLLGYARQGDRLVQVEPLTWESDPRDRLLRDPVVSSDAAATSVRPLRIDVFAAACAEGGTIGWLEVELTADGGSRTRWQALDDGHTVATGRPAVTSARPGCLDLFFRSEDGRLCHGCWRDSDARWNVR
jgi:hypothetical protein